MLINVGSESVFHALCVERVVGIFSLRGAGVQRAKREFEKRGDLIDLRFGAKAKSLVVLDNKTAILSPHNSRILMQKLNSNPLGIVTAPIRKKAA